MISETKFYKLAYVRSFKVRSFILCLIVFTFSFLFKTSRILFQIAGPTKDRTFI